jgi:hypothetical protein
MVGFKRFFSAEPSRATLRAIEGVSLIERPPAAIPDGVGTGVVCIVGEFEDGPMDAPTEVRKKTDLINTFGAFGFTKSGKPYQHPVARRSGGSELWNGNGYLALRGKKFSRLIVTRVNTSAGKVKFRRLATLTSSERGPHDLEPSATFEIERDGAGLTATVNATAGTIQAAGGVYPTNFNGGEYILVKDEFNNIRKVTFADGDESIGQCITAINAQLAYTAATNNAGQILLTSRVRGSTGRIEITGGTASALTALGFTLTNTAEVDVVTVVVANNGVYTFTVAVWTAGVITTYTGTYTHAAAETATQTRDALISNFNATNPTAPVTLSTSGAAAINITSNVAGVPITTAITSTPNPGDFTTGNVTPNSTSFGLGTGNVADVDRVSDAELVTLIDALSGVSAVLLSTGYIRITNTQTPESGTLEITGGTVATSLGFEVGDSSNAGVGAVVTIPAGTLIQDTAGNYWLTLETYETDTTGGPFELDVRPATDDDSTPSTAGSTATTLVDILDDGFAVTNDAALTRISPAGLDAAYRRAIESTAKSSESVVKEINIIFSARITASIIQSLIGNVETTRAQEFNLRVGVYSPPIGTSIDDIISSTTIGVRAANNRSYMFCRGPGVLVPIPEIAELGAAGGTGFNDEGVINQHFDGWYASIRSIMPPEENVGQDLSRTVYGALPILGLEETYNSAYGGTALEMGDYIALAAAGVGAPKMGKTGCSLQTDCTCLPVASDPQRSEANYRFMFDFIGDSLRELCEPYVKTLVKPANSIGALTNIQGFLEGLKSEGDRDQARIDDFSAEDETLDENAALGDRDLQVDVLLLKTAKYFNIGLTVGTNVTINNANT